MYLIAVQLFNYNMVIVVVDVNINSRGNYDYLKLNMSNVTFNDHPV